MAIRWQIQSAVIAALVVGMSGDVTPQPAPISSTYSGLKNDQPRQIDPRHLGISRDELAQLNMHCWQGHERACLVLREFRQSGSQTTSPTGSAEFCLAARGDCESNAAYWRG